MECPRIWPSSIGQKGRVKTRLDGIMESEHVYDIRYNALPFHGL
jgi:hypothetical protein